MSQHYTNSMDEICVPVIKKILGHYLELNPDYNNRLQRNQQPNDGSEENKYLTIKSCCYTSRGSRQLPQFSRLPNGLDNDFKKQRDIESVIWVDTDFE